MANIELFVTHSPNRVNYTIRRTFVKNIIAGGNFQAAEVPEGYQLDNTGDNISELNPSYCELTTLYWAWKNASSDYYGFCHYRRLFSFAPQPLNRDKEWGVFPFERLSEKSLAELHWSEEDLHAAVEGYDFVIAQHINTRALGAKSVWEHWRNAQELRNDDYQQFLKVIHEKYPSFAPVADEFSQGNVFYPCNMFIAKKELLDDYCTMLFDILEEFEKRVDMSRYSIEGRRVTGHLAERFLGMYYEYLKKKGTYKLKELEVAYFANTQAPMTKKPSCDGALPIVLASNDEYVPYLDVCLSSLYKHASPKHFYDVVVFASDISSVNQERLKARSDEFKNIALTFIDVDPLLEGYDLETTGIIDHVTTETFFRFLILDVMASYSKVLYLDCDMLIQEDVGLLFDEDMGDALVGAVVDPDYAANLNISDVREEGASLSGSSRYDYSKNVLKMKDPFTYFQAGLIMFNMPELNAKTSTTELMEMAQSPEYIYMDQDILNSVCDGRIHYYDMSWNVLMDHSLGLGRLALIKKFAPAKMYESYAASRINPKVIHYAGPEKPWLKPDSDFAFEFWEEAQCSPYYEGILLNMGKNGMDDGGRKGLLWSAERKVYRFMRRVYHSIRRRVWGY